MWKKLSLPQAFLMFALLSLVMLLIPSLPVRADSTQQKVYDKGKLLSEEEEVYLDKLSNKIGSKRKIDIVILTLNDPKITDSLSYLNDFFAEKQFGYNKALGDTVLISVDMANRDIYIRGHGICETYINNTRANNIADKTKSYFTKKEYAEGFDVFINTVDRYMGVSPRFNPDSLLLKWYIQLAAAIVVGGIITAVMAAHRNPSSTTSSRTYLNATNTNLTVQRDDFIRTSMTRVKKPETHSGGGSGGSKSSGGGSGGGSTGHAKF